MATGEGKARRGPLLLVVLLAYGLIRGARVAAGGEGLLRSGYWLRQPRPDPTPGSTWKVVRRWLAALALAVIVIAATDWLGSHVVWQVNTYDRHWWGPAEETGWGDAADHGVTLGTRDLAITISGDTLTATYTVTTAPSSPAVRTAESDADSNAGNDLVGNLLGNLQVAEFRYGVTGNALSGSQVAFAAPQLQIPPLDKNKRVTATITVESIPVRLYRHRQQITIAPPSGFASGLVTTTITVDAPGAQVTDPVNARITTVSNGAATVLVDSTKQQMTSFTVSEGETATSWFDGLRAVGRIQLPVADGLFSRLGGLFVYAVLLWALYRARRAFPGDPLIRLGLGAIQVIVVALGVVAVAGFVHDLSLTLDRNGDRDYLTAGPTGLLTGAATVLWPVACWRAGRRDSADSGSAGDPRGRGPARSPGPGPRRSWWRRGLLVVLVVLVHLAIAGLYWARMYRLGVGPLTSPSVMAGTAVVVVAVPLLTRQLIGGSPLTWLASAGLLAAVFAAASSWPLLLRAVYWRQPYVNNWGKWAFVAMTVAVTAGLCLMWGRIAWAVLRHPRDRFRALPTATVIVVIAVIVAAIVPDAVSESAVMNPRVGGLVPFDLFGLADSLPQLLDWLLLGLAMAVIRELPPGPKSRLVARDLALPVALMLLYWNNTWLYLPVTMIVGTFLIRWLMMPRELAEQAPDETDPRKHVQEAADGWRRAELTAGQQQALATSSTETLRESMLTGTDSEFRRLVGQLTSAHDELADRRERYRGAARAAKNEAFSHSGAALGRGYGRPGVITGVVVGLVPVTVALLTTQPPDAGGSYPILGFFGSTAWTLLTWAGLGWFIGHFLPLIRGGNGVQKAMWIFIVGVAASLPVDLVWNDANDWVNEMVAQLMFAIFLAVVTVIVCDLRTLRDAGLPMSDWVRVHNWRFVASWSTALLAAVGTIVLTFATTTITDLSQQFTQSPNTSQSAPHAPTTKPPRS